MKLWAQIIFFSDGVHIYANNKEETIVIEGELPNQTQVQLFDINGRVIVSQTFNSKGSNHNIDASQLSSGIYVLEVVGGTNIRRVEKLIIK